jgi:hypothetical protein
MATTITNNFFKMQAAKTPYPNTPRGRALHTIDWFINGKPVLSNHDNPRLSLVNGQPCCY